MKRKILRLYLTLKKEHYHFNTEIHIGFNIANLFCDIALFNNLFNFLFRIVWIKKYLVWGWNRKKLNDEARIICNLTLRNFNVYGVTARYYFNKWIFRKEIDMGRCYLLCGFAKDLETSINISVWSSEIIEKDEDNYIYSDITISLLGFRILFGR